MKVLIFDGECNFCSKFIRFIVKINEDPDLYITDFDTKWTKKNFINEKEIDSVIYIANDRQYIYSDAVFHLLADASRWLKPIILLKLVPRSIRDTLYKMIARYRKSLPMKTVCERPNTKFLKMYLS